MTSQALPDVVLKNPALFGVYRYLYVYFTSVYPDKQIRMQGTCI